MNEAQKIEEIVARLEPAIRKAFLEAVQDIRSEAQLRLIVGHLEAGRFDLALDALNLREEFFAPLDGALRSAYIQGGMEALGLLPSLPGPFGGRAVLRFDGRNERAENWLRNHSSSRIQEIVEDQRQGVRAVLEERMEQGVNPRVAALDVTGRINKQTGRREGGLVGLHSQQMQYVANMRAELADPEAMANYFTRKRRDRRLDGVVRRAMEAGKPLSKSDIERLVARYSDRLLAYRGEVIARTEALSAFNAARFEGLEQLIDNGTLQREDVALEWLAASDARTRDSHRALNGQQVTLGQAFVSPVTGARMRYPTDTEIGAPASDIIQCRCTTITRIDRFARFGRAA